MEIVFESLGPETVKALLGKKFSNRQIRLFSLSGIDGYAFNSAPYYFPKLVKQALEEATRGDDGIMYPAADTRLQLLAFHMLFHGEQFANLDDISSSKYFGELAILAQQAGQPCPVNIAQLEKRLHESGHFPSRDLIGFYSRNNPFVTQQYLRKEFKPGLATLFIRDFPEQTTLHEPIKNYLRKHFQVVAEGPITNELGTMVADQIRGGNWFVNQMAGEAPPIYWFVCYDPDPQRVTKKIARNYPTCDNMRIVTSKRHLRSLARDDAGETVRIVHASDNSDDAYENVRILGLEGNENIKRVVAGLRIFDV
ncbi:MAG: hypothetical protein COA52_07195 [Hyphomicrobiales bacterium]|nr:hypothetical protein [Hyphomicrobiales bacterium]PCJ92738.1 MAG: hypothetical protein COA52_07195 [Hyphomicrobiales bacterium]